MMDRLTMIGGAKGEGEEEREGVTVARGDVRLSVCEGDRQAGRQTGGDSVKICLPV